MLDTGYFDGILNEHNNGGYEALIYELMHYPIENFDLRKVIRTEALLEQQIGSFKEDEQLWYNILCLGELPCSTKDEMIINDGVPGAAVVLWRTIGAYYGADVREYHVKRHKIFNLYQRFTNRRVGKNKSHETSFGMRLTQFFPLLGVKGSPVRDRNNRMMGSLRSAQIEREWYYIIPPLNVCREMFDAYFQQREQTFD